MSNTSAKVKNAYAKRNYDDIRLQVKKGMKEQIRNHAQEKGYSLQGYINFLIQKDMHTKNDEYLELEKRLDSLSSSERRHAIADLMDVLEEKYPKPL